MTERDVLEERLPRTKLDPQIRELVLRRIQAEFTRS
jgi:hypothetical protein